MVQTLLVAPQVLPSFFVGAPQVLAPYVSWPGGAVAQCVVRRRRSLCTSPGWTCTQRYLWARRKCSVRSRFGWPLQAARCVGAPQARAPYVSWLDLQAPICLGAPQALAPYVVWLEIRQNGDACVK